MLIQLKDITKELLYAMYDKMPREEHNMALADVAEELKSSYAED